MAGQGIITLAERGTTLTEGKAGAPVAGTGTSVPVGVEGTIEYRGNYFNIRGWQDAILILGIDGLGDADIRDSREVNPSAHGETAFSAYYGGRTLALTGRIRAQSLQKMRDMQQGLKQAFADVSREYPLIFHSPTNPQQSAMIYCKKSQPIAMAETQANFQHNRDFLVTLRASNPRFLSLFTSFLQYSGFRSDAFGTPATVDRTNLMPNPSAERSATDGGMNGTNATVARTTSVAQSHTAAFQLTSVAAGNMSVRNSTGRFAVTAGTVYSAAAEFRAASAARNCVVYLDFYDAGGTRLQLTAGAVVANTTTGWTRCVVQNITAPAGAVTAQVISEIQATGAASEVHYVDSIIANVGATVHDYFDGSTGSGSIYGYRWVGEPHRSASERWTVSGFDTTNWTFLVATKGASITPSGAVRFAHNFGVEARYNGFGATPPVDIRVTAKVKTPADSTQLAYFDLIPKIIDSTNYLTVRFAISAATSSLTAYALNAGATTSLGSQSPFTTAANTNYWLRTDITGNVWTTRVFSVDPALNPNATPLATLTTTLTGTNASKYGAGIALAPGFRTAAAGSTVHNNDMEMDDYKAEQVAATGYQIGTCLNNGNFPAQPQIQISGPINTPRLAFIDATTQATIGTFRFDGNIPSGETWMIDVAKRTIQDANGVSKFSSLSISSDWPELVPGGTILQVDGTGLDANTTFAVTWRHTWM